MRKVWPQRGAESSEAPTVAKELGLEAVSGKCILMYATPARSTHNSHRAVAKLVGQLRIGLLHGVAHKGATVIERTGS